MTTEDKLSANQNEAPICRALLDYHGQGYLPFTTPGHKLGKGVDDNTLAALGLDTFYNDIPLLAGLDNRTESNDIRTKAERLAAEAFGAQRTFFSVNGSSLSAHAALIAVANPDEVVIIARNCHKSMIAACVFAGVRPIFIETEVNEELDLEQGIEVRSLERELKRHPEAVAVVVVSPNYYGFCSDVKALAEVCHRYDVCLIVDEAWGPHFPFHPDLPKSAMHNKADMSLASIHKMMNGLGQASVINIQGSLIDEERTELAIDFFESSSPSSLILASIDGARRYMAISGRAALQNALLSSRELTKQLKQLPGLRVIGSEILNSPGTYFKDELKVVVDVTQLGISGFKAAEYLQNEHKVMVELSDPRRIMFIVSVGDDSQSIEQLVDAMRNMVSKVHAVPFTSQLVKISMLRTECVMPPREAFFRHSKKVLLEHAHGMIAAEMVSPYPPGIPRLIPGEIITENIIRFLKDGVNSGMYVDALDSTMKTVRVVDHKKIKTG